VSSVTLGSVETLGSVVRNICWKEFSLTNGYLSVGP
jgi:hypothetical protein